MSGSIKCCSLIGEGTTQNRHVYQAFPGNTAQKIAMLKQTQHFMPKKTEGLKPSAKLRDIARGKIRREDYQRRAWRFTSL